MSVKTKGHTAQGIQILDNGAWNWDTSTEDHSCNVDSGFLDYLIEFSKANNQKLIMDFGCATGYFLKYISERLPDVNLLGVEAAASKKSNLHFSNIVDHDLAIPFNLDKKGLVMSIEVMEHIPPQFESIAVDNLIKHCDEYLFLTWAPVGQGGWGHFNEKNMPDVIKLFEARGFVILASESAEARERSKISWIKRNLVIFKKVK